MKISDLLLMSITNLWKRKLRTVLTVLGVVIGITSIVVMISLGNGLKESVMTQMQRYSNITQITINSNSYYGYSDAGSSTEHMLNDAFVKELSQMEHVVAVYPQLRISTQVKSGKYRGYFDILGVTPEYMQNDLELGEGTYPQAGNELELLFGNTILSSFYNEKTYVYDYYDKGELPDIDLLKDNIYAFFEVSATDDSGTATTIKKKVTGVGIMEGEIDDWTMESSNIYCNIDTLKTVLKKTYKGKAIPNQPTKKNGKPYKELFYSTILVQVDEIDNVVPLTAAITEAGYSAYNDAEWIQQQQQQMNMIQSILGLIGAVSLLVAAIGITNTMMMSIYERTKEIGVMKVLGCDIRNIQALFLMEAGFIGLIGGIVGVLLSAAGCHLLNVLATTSNIGQEMGFGGGNVCAMPVWLPGMAIAFAIVIGMTAGFMPSLRAMKLSPLAAIRNE